ncbi:dual specificity protein kinase pyk3 [Topomyia yanbarensis]|uniref:dual specificity protein kinase pyk3 n=1 Tax=Topomyia yanbarensis TaxID=2498891 RepID=UPI00273AC3D0|nr:dual specificity protein kinase pyk3 [Topomyia yanbarensis]
MPFGRKSPLEALAMPGAIIAYKYSQYRQRRREAANRRVTERELTALHNKIEKLLSKLEESELEPPTSQEDECVICINARATMQTSPCGHRVVCRRCFVKTIQSAVAQRLLPLRCVICRARINKLTSGSTSWRLQGSASSYSMSSKSWSVPGSASSYSVDDPRVTQSASLYSMSSGSSCMSGISNLSNCSGTSGMSSSSSNSGIGDPHQHHHTHSNLGHHHKHSNGTCSSGCLGAIPRNPSYQHHHKKGLYYSKNRFPEMPNRLPPIIEFKSPTRHRTPSPANPGARFKYYTQPGKPANAVVESIPLLSIEKPSKPGPSKLGLNGKIAPTASKSPINKTNMATGKPVTTSLITAIGTPPKARVVSAASTSHSSSVCSSIKSNNFSNNSNNNSSTIKQDEKYDNKKNETIEKKKKEEKLKLKAEKDARKEEKRIAKEEEKLAKMLAKEEKKRGKREAKESLLANEGGSQK